MRMRRRRREESASPNLTPMIDVTFQLLIFFLLCTRFIEVERSHASDLPLTDGFEPLRDVPRETVTVYCLWEPETRTAEYVVAIGARNRTAVHGSRARLGELVIFPSDSMAAIADKKAVYARVHASLRDSLQQAIARSGARIDCLEISSARDATVGAASGTAPWMFTSLAIDAAAEINKERERRGLAALGVKFKFMNALSR